MLASDFGGLGLGALAVLALAVACGDDSPSSDGRGLTGGFAGRAAAGARTGAGGSSYAGDGLGGLGSVDGMAGECSTSDLRLPEDGGSAGEAGSAGSGGRETCRPPATTYAPVPETTVSLCGCALAPYTRAAVLCYAPPAAGETCETAYPDVCVSGTWVCGATHGAPILCRGDTDPTTGAAACCYLLVGECILTP